MKKHIGLYLLALVAAAVIAAGCGTSAAASTPAAVSTTRSSNSAAPTAAPAPTSTTAAAPTATAAVKPTATATPAPKAATPAPTVTQAPATSSGGGTPDVILNSQRALLKQKAYRATGTVQAGPGISLTTVMEAIPPDRVHLITSNLEQIVIKGAGAWEKVRGGQWQVNPAGQAAGDALLAALDPAQIDKTVEQIVVSDFKSLGTEQLNGKAMKVYQYTTTVTLTATGTVVPGTTKVWIGAQDGLPYKDVTQTPNLGTGAGSSTRTTIFTYDSSIKIESPM